MKNNTSNIKIALQASPDSPEGVLLAQQLGVEYLSMWSGAETYDEYKAIVDQAAKAGLQIATCSSISNDEQIVLAPEGRDEVIERYQNSLRAMGRRPDLSHRLLYGHRGHELSARTARAAAPAREPTGTATACPKRATALTTFPLIGPIAKKSCGKTTPTLFAP